MKAGITSFFHIRLGNLSDVGAIRQGTDLSKSCKADNGVPVSPRVMPPPCRYLR